MKSHKFSKPLAFFLTLLIFLSLANGAFAQTGQIGLEEAIKIVKSRIEIPDTLTNFDSGLENNNYGQKITLRWYKENIGEINVSVDTRDGDIVHYYGFNYSDDVSLNLKNVILNKEKGQKIAQEFLHHVAPHKGKHFVLLEGQEYSYGNFITYQFVRMVNGIPYKDNLATVTVNLKTNKVTNFYLDWEDLQSPEAKGLITEEKAKDIFKDILELNYWAKNKPIKLVYAFPHTAIDAFSGEVVEFRKYFITNDLESAAEIDDLLPHEQIVTDKIKNLLTQDQAKKKVEELVSLQGYKLNSATLNRDYHDAESYKWYLTWEKRDDNENSSWIYAEVDAQSGKVLNFSKTARHNPDGKSRITREEAEKVALEFLKKHFPETIDNIQLQKERYTLPEAQVHYFNYKRLYNGIPVINDYVHVAVDGITKEVREFSLRFTEAKFPDASFVLTKEAFLDSYFTKYPLSLSYIKDENDDIRLVYQLKDSLTYYFDATSGKNLDYKGDEIREKLPVKLTKETPYQEELLKLDKLDLLYAPEGVYDPSLPLTQAELIKMLTKSSYPILTDKDDTIEWYASYYQSAKSLNLIKEEEINPSAKVTKKDLALFLARKLVADEILSLPIYKMPDFKDAQNIPSNYYGAIQILKARNLFEKETLFLPNAEINRGEAAKYFVKFLEI